MLTLLSCCSTNSTSVRIEHITRKGILSEYKPAETTFSAPIKSKAEPHPYIDTQQEEPLFDESEFNTPEPKIGVEGLPCVREKIEYQEDVEKLAKLKRAGRLSQKEYNARIAALHARNRVKQKAVPSSPSPVPAAPQAAQSAHTSMALPQEHQTEVSRAVYSPAAKKIEAIHIDADDEIFREE